MKAFKKLVFILIFIVLVVQIYVLYKDDNKAVASKDPMVAVSSFALYDIAKHIAQENIKIINILPLGVDPHSFEPTPKLMAEIENSNLIFFSGAGLEPWTHGFAFNNRAIDMSEHVTLRELTQGEHDEHEHVAEHCDHSGIDPHYWLDFINMQKATTVIKEELIKLQPEHAKVYEQNAAEYISRLKKLHEEYLKTLGNCTSNVVIVNHNAIGYLAYNYDFRVESLSGLSPEAQPSPKDLTRIFQEIKDEGVSTIFFENFVNDKAIQAVANDANVNLEVFQALGNITAEEAEQNLTYEQIMRMNLTKLSKALECK
jgi:zinc transport system substrate-binding protein